jgi:hypothetical protein
VFVIAQKTFSNNNTISETKTPAAVITSRKNDNKHIQISQAPKVYRKLKRPTAKTRFKLQ